jgi:hypothetical protein
METDLDLGDKLRATDKELSGERLIDIQYTSQTTSMSYNNNMLYTSPANEHQSTMDPILRRPITPGQLRKNSALHTVDTLVHSLVINSQSDGFENQIRKSEEEEPTNSPDHDRAKSNSSESTNSSTSSTIELNPNS